LRWQLIFYARQIGARFVTCDHVFDAWRNVSALHRHYLHSRAAEPGDKLHDVSVSKREHMFFVQSPASVGL
jgi:hypothetical protein